MNQLVSIDLSIQTSFVAICFYMNRKEAHTVVISDSGEPRLQMYITGVDLCFQSSEAIKQRRGYKIYASDKAGVPGSPAIHFLIR